MQGAGDELRVMRESVRHQRNFIVIRDRLGGCNINNEPQEQALQEGRQD